jgi:hypothetical protein
MQHNALLIRQNFIVVKSGYYNASRSSGLLRVEASLARVSQSGLKTGGGATTGGARGTITEVASEAS